MFLEQYFHLFFGHILLLGHSFLSDKYSHFQLSIYFYRNETSNNQSMYDLANSELPLNKTNIVGLLLLHIALYTRVNNRIFFKYVSSPSDISKYNNQLIYSHLVVQVFQHILLLYMGLMQYLLSTLQHHILPL